MNPNTPKDNVELDTIKGLITGQLWGRNYEELDGNWKQAVDPLADALLSYISKQVAKAEIEAVDRYKRQQYEKVVVNKDTYNLIKELESKINE